MVEMYLHATFNLNPRPPPSTRRSTASSRRSMSTTPTPNAVIAIAASKNSAELTRKIYGDEVIWTPWQRPGFDLGLQLQKVAREHPQAKGIIMGQHGLINWAETDEECYNLTLTLIEKAARYLADHDKGAKTFGGAKYQSLPETPRRDLLAQLLPWLRARSASSAGSSAPGRTTRRPSPSPTATTRSGWPGSAPRARTISCGPRSSALRRLEPAGREARGPEEEAGARHRGVPEGLPQVLREV